MKSDASFVLLIEYARTLTCHRDVTPENSENF